MKSRTIALILSAVFAAMPAAAAQAQKKAGGKKATTTPSPEPTAAPTPSPVPQISAACTGEKYRQFDFWLGDWDLVGNDGKKTADDRVAMSLGGCAMEERWTGVKSGQGLSFSAYDPATHHWHQTLMDDSGAVLNLEGEFADGKMILVGQHPAKEKGVTITHRIAWTPQPDKSVKQIWETSRNGGRTWRTVSEGTYVPKKAS